MKYETHPADLDLFRRAQQITADRSRQCFIWLFDPDTQHVVHYASHRNDDPNLIIDVALRRQFLDNQSVSSQIFNGSCCDSIASECQNSNRFLTIHIGGEPT